MQLTNLSNKQIKMLNIMWSIDDAYDLEIWQSTLSKEDYCMSVSLQELLVAEYLDDSVKEDDCKEATLYLDAIRRTY